jgi:hypothetical protein
MTHQFLLHFHWRSGLVQPRTIRVAERMPTYRRVPSSGNPSLVVDREPLAVGGELILPAPNSDIGAALRTRRKTWG